MNTPWPFLPDWFAKQWKSCCMDMVSAVMVEGGSSPHPQMRRRRQRTHWSLYGIWHGNISCHGGGFSLDIPDQHLALIPPNDGFAEHAQSDGGSIRTMIIDFRVQGQMAQSDPLTSLILPATVPMRDPIGLESWAARLSSWQPARRTWANPSAPIRLRSAVDLLLLEFLEDHCAVSNKMHGRAVNRPVPDWLSDLIKHLGRCPSSSHASLQNLARRSGYSPGHVRREFLRILGRSPAQHFRACCLTKAKTMLLSNRNLSIQELAVHCGYGSAARFCREFKRQVGCSPRRWRVLSGMDGPATPTRTLKQN